MPLCTMCTMVGGVALLLERRRLAGELSLVYACYMLDM